MKAKERKQKIFVAVGGGFLLLLLVVLGPSTWKSFNAKPPEEAVSAPPAPSAPASSTAPAATATDGARAVLVAETAPPPEDGQLSSFR
ncbi:MAG: hypothetical protein M3M94_06665, partial [Actinomycetota bacterium]|nr:hypothetical protein [Actinomycetota bacterium]